MFYERFVLLCKQRGVSTSKAAIDAGLSKSTVTKWKKDPNTKPSGNVIDKLCRYFGISVSELLGANDASQPEEDVRPVTQQDIKFALFGGSGDTANMPCTKLCREDFAGDEIDILTLLVKCGLAPSKAEARRLVQQGGVSVDGQKVGDIAAKWTCKDCCGEGVVVKKGKKVYHKAILEEK